MNNRIKYISIALFILVGLLYWIFHIYPSSVRLVLAGQSNCEFTKEQIEEIHPNFWEYALSKLYRAKYLYLGGPLQFLDPLSGNTTALHSLLIAYDSYDGACEKSVFPLIKTYLARGADVNLYGEFGYTPLHEAIIMNHPDMVEEFMNSGGTPNLVVKSENKKIFGKTAIDLAAYMYEKDRNESSLEILKLVKKSRT